MKQFLGKVVRRINTDSVSIIVYISEHDITPGGYAAMSIDEFNEMFEFVDEGDKKDWEDFSAPLIAKKMLKSDNRNELHHYSENIRKAYYRQKIKSVKKEI